MGYSNRSCNRRGYLDSINTRYSQGIIFNRHVGGNKLIHRTNQKHFLKKTLNKKNMKLLGIIFAFIAATFKRSGIPAASQTEHLEFLGFGRTKENWSAKEKKRAKEQGNLNIVMNRVTNDMECLEDYEGETLEDYEAAEADWDSSLEEQMESYLENLLQGESVEDLARPRRRMVAGRMGKRFGRRGSVYTAHRGLGSRGMGGKMTGIKGQITLIITRLTYTILKDLPVQLFNPLDNTAGNPLVTKYLPQNVAFLGSATNPADGSVVFTFKDLLTNAVDNVTVQIQEVPYIKFLEGLKTSMFQVGGGPAKSPGGTIQISDVTATVQFTKQWVFTEQNILGKGSDNPLNAGSFIAAEQFRPDIQNILIGFPIDAENGLIFNSAYINGYTPGMQLVTTFFLSFSRVLLHNHKNKFGRR